MHMSRYYFIQAISPGSACTFSRLVDSENQFLLIWRLQTIHVYGCWDHSLVGWTMQHQGYRTCEINKIELVREMKQITFFFSLIPHSSIYQLLPLLFSNNGKKAWHHTAIVPCHRMEKAASTTSTVVPILDLEHRSRDGKHIWVNE